ncbi:MAG TPA: CBS domain-containing protein [Candidatus Bathyarchaeia archaeon]|nr:CBS domain-containing protein [Candidatus Bathyarchaeia archaeon]
MTKEVITVTENTPLKEAAGILAKFRIHGLPVIDENNKLIGIVTEGDFFTKDASNIFLPTFLDFINDKSAGAKEAPANGLEKISTVGDIMTREFFSVTSEQTVEELIKQIKEKNFNSMPVVDSEGTIVGIVAIMDVIKLL